MTDQIQVNMRVPVAAKDTMIRVARLLRESPAFVHRLKRLVDEEQDPQLGALLSQRMDRLEAQVAAILAERPLKGPKAGPERDDHTASMFEGTSGNVAWTTGEGRGRRLTEEGRAEIDRLLAAGHSDAQIADRLGIKPFAVKARRANAGRTEG